MKKAILVIDVISMPTGCQECNFCSCDGDECLLLSKDISEKVYLENKRLSECPLRELPEKHNTDARQVGEQWAVFNQGWNACLDAIEGSKANE